ncbi:MerR family transcriptional regulator [Paenibacillus flagellatus]|uniref:MerR family transcriptional regulator n=1 Tax=Paenibacillus flagellatus TaxID=2211139 RepID=A0A2V5JWN2_9BACL|nr:MerR family transcriptional regulator [Paenibacillus flagellatus]PYI51011.1 MerR family transcriptional regulator [Paenibacillus flagellatus]
MEPYLSIQAVAELTGITAHTLRYYERNGLIHAIARETNGRRRYSADDLAWIRFLARLRTTGMSIRQMQRIADLRRQGPATTRERRLLLEAHKAKLAEQIAKLQEHYDVIVEKIDTYRKWEMDRPGKGGEER